MIHNETHSQRYLRPVVWGFFVSAFILAGGLLYRVMTDRWMDSHRSERIESAAHQRSQMVRERFDREKSRLLRKASSIAERQEIVSTVKQNNPMGAALVFDFLNRARENEETSIDIADAGGSVVAWSGPSVVASYRDILNGEEQDSIAAVVFDELHAHLVVGLRVPRESFFVFVASPLERTYPLTTPFVSQQSLLKEIRDASGIRVRLVSLLSAHGASPGYTPLLDFHGKTIAYARLEEPVEGESNENITDVSSVLSRTGAACAALFGAMVLALRFGRQGGSLSQAFLQLVLIWGVRVSWVALGFPASLFEWALFDPRLYSSQFGYGLASTLGDVVISVVALVLSVVYPLSNAVAHARKKLTAASLPKAFTLILSLTLVLGICFLLRAYSATLRSFVFDSTLAFRDTTSMLPEAEVVLAHLTVLLLSFVCIAVSVTLYELLIRLMSAYSMTWRIGFLTTATVCGWLLFLALDRQYQVPASWLFIALIAFGTGGFVKAENILSLSQSIGAMFVFALVLSFTVLDRKIHEKEREQIRLRGEELLLPSDSWLTLVAENAFRRVQQEYMQMRDEVTGDTGRGKKIAFRLWARTPLSQRNYSTTLVVYDKEANEISRFGIGMASYEQTELLQKLFNEDEERVYVLPGFSVEDRYYGIWGTIRDENNELQGYAALIVSKPEGFERASYFLMTSPVGNEGSYGRRTYVVRYRSGSVAETNFTERFVGMHLSDDVVEELARQQFMPVWRDERVGNRAFECLYLQNPNSPSEVIAILSEELDIRWHAFHLLKVAVLYLIIMGLAMSIMLARRWRSIRIGFREKLLAVLMAAVITPIVVMVYYNQYLIEERARQSRTKELERQLNLVHKYLKSSILEEEDFYRGITDDFCASGASVLGIEFSVFRGYELLASSRRDLYEAEILESRLSGTAFANAVLRGKHFYEDTERVGELTYAAGYRPVTFNGRVLGVISVSTLHRQREIEADIFEWNAFAIVINAIVLLFVIGAGLFISERLALPLRILRDAAIEVGKGRLDITVPITSRDEVGELMHSFNVMIERLRQNRDDLARIERELAWKEMAKQVAHEIKNPLTPMKLNVQHLQQAYRDKAPDFDFIMRTVTATIIDQIDTLARIATEFSNFARMPDRRFERVDLHRLLEETVFLFKNVQGVEFRVNFSDTKPTIVADRDELRRVFVNIVRNSIQAMNEGGTITIATRRKDGRCVITISDTGAGIPEALRDKVFQPNFSTKTDGMGIGLALSRKIIEDLNGSITLESNVGVGTSISITLPIHE